MYLFVFIFQSQVGGFSLRVEYGKHFLHRELIAILAWPQL